MIYCVSDIHGRIDLFNKLLDIINLKDNDVLYVLGDCIDRGGKLACLRLDDMKEYYIEDNKKVNIPIDQINSYFSENNFNMNELIYSFDAIKELST